MTSNQDLLRLLRYQILDRRNASEEARDRLMLEAADEIERLREELWKRDNPWWREKGLRYTADETRAVVLPAVQRPPLTFEADETALVPEDFAAWLRREVPPGTVISDPDWWAPRILRAVARATGKS